MNTVYWLSVLCLLASAGSAYMSHYVADDHRWDVDSEQTFSAVAWITLALSAVGFGLVATF